MTNKIPASAIKREDTAQSGGASSTGPPLCRSLYIHVPFCLRKCSYCAFESAPPRPGDFKLWLDSLRRELTLQSRALGRLTLDTCYIGGGTPTALPPSVFDELIALAEEFFDFASDAEVTVEANPHSLQAEHLLSWRDWRVTRVSVGAQSFDDAELEMMGRLHDSARAREAVSASLAAGFSVSADFIFALPFQSVENWSRTLHEATRLGLSHISLYQLTVEQGTPWERLPRENLPDGYPHYRFAQWYLPRRGFRQYEIANFACPGKESRHNLNYWRYGEYLGVGPAAAGFIGGTRTKNIASLDEYAAVLKEGHLPVCESETLDAKTRASEAAILALRTAEGIRRGEFSEKFGAGELARVEKTALGFPRGLCVSDARGLRFTKSGMRVANRLWEELL